jgi:hypothetical protein
MSVNGQRVTNLRFPIGATDEQEILVSLLTGEADGGVSARVVRVDPQAADAYGTRLEEPPELQRGDYARWARNKGVTSLEHLAELSDDEAAALGMGWTWRRDLARQFLEGRAGGSADLAPVTNREVAALDRQSVPVVRPSSRLSRQLPRPEIRVPAPIGVPPAAHARWMWSPVPTSRLPETKPGS